MNMKLFVDSLTWDEINALSNVIYEKRRLYYRQMARPLSEEEIELVKSYQTIEAIKSYRARHGVSLLEAKIAVDAYREQR